MKHYRLRTRHDRNGKQARCVCGWEGPWRRTKSTGRRSKDAQARYDLIRQDYLAHLPEDET